MGLFDEIVCEYPLPGWPTHESPRFQTKDLDCSMDTYRISADGRLLRSRSEGAPEWHDVEYHGVIGFYTSLERAGGREWFEYTAKFTDGRLVGAERMQPALPA